MVSNHEETEYAGYVANVSSSFLVLVVARRTVVQDYVVS